jgi:hypothetical protein
VVHDGGKCFPWETFVSRLSPAIAAGDARPSLKKGKQRHIVARLLQ